MITSSDIEEEEFPPIHLTLWHLSKTYIAQARSLATSNSKRNSTQKQLSTLIAERILAAIRCLKAILILKPPGDLDRLHYTVQWQLAETLLEWGNSDRGGILEAETWLNKAIMTSNKLPPNPKNQFYLMDLQSRILRRLGKHNALQKVLSTAISEATQIKEYQMMYHFMLSRIQYSSEQTNAIKFLSTACQECLKRSDHEMRAIFLFHHVGLLLNNPPLPTSVNSPMTHLDTLFPQEHAIIQNDHLKCIYLLLKTIWNLFIGDVKQAIVTLSSTHRLLEGDTNILSNGYLEIKINDSLSSNGISHIKIKFFDRSQLFALAFLVSGMVYQSGDNGKAKRFLNEGLSAVANEFKNQGGDLIYQDVVYRRQWFIELKILLLKHLIFVHILRTEFMDACSRLIELVERTTPYPHFLQKYKLTIALILGFIYQSCGRVEDATAWFQMAQSGHDPKDADNRFMATVVKSLVNFNESQWDEIIGNLNDSIKDISNQGCVVSEVKVGLLSMLNGLKSTLSGEIKNTKQNFLNTLKSADSLNSNQFRILSLSVLGDLFLQTDRGQAEKMYSTAYVLAKKSKSEAFATVCSSALSVLSEISNAGEERDKFEGISLTHQGNYENAINSVKDILDSFNE